MVILLTEKIPRASHLLSVIEFPSKWVRIGWKSQWQVGLLEVEIGCGDCLPGWSSDWSLEVAVGRPEWIWRCKGLMTVNTTMVSPSAPSLLTMVAFFLKCGIYGISPFDGSSGQWSCPKGTPNLLVYKCRSVPENCWSPVHLAGQLRLRPRSSEPEPGQTGINSGH